MPRNDEQFNETLKNAEWYVKFHKKPVWLVPTETEYRLSSIKPVPYGLPHDTSAILIDVENGQMIYTNITVESIN